MTATELRGTGLPILVIVGAQDGMAPSVRAMGREMADAVETEVIPDTDHYTAPRHPQFLERLVTFLRESG